ncbi:DUF5667 domain-containing protein [Micromonospora craniellae]|uniref:DUF5667 domain-containing protein n=1 Tax=Micromonospora craniellae TaxID=2294034 RepID=A0A372G6N9_9ACTN|nr:DUF5667 domain-containing protein [Micromonospora craniellae]QOC90176.1 hypothetical protein ID554_18465 [Micromonospora craniellae]RFS48436.1 hypothetical protein D0Q02_02885 [Micromonospora craniellae]
MDNALFSRRRTERFAQLLDEANGGLRHHVRSRADDQLAPLVALSRQLGANPPNAEVDPEFRTGLRAMLLATADREGIGTTVAGPAERAATGRGSLLPAVTARRARARGAILVGIAAGAIAVSGISAASENAVPGDALYGMKRSTERAQLALASSEISRGQLFLDFARTRMAEASSLRGDRPGYRGVLDDMDVATRQGVSLLTGAAVRHADPAALNTVEAFLTGQRRTLDALTERGSRADQERTARSLVLLDLVAERTEALRAAIACGRSAGTASDDLGPTPGACA